MNNILLFKSIAEAEKLLKLTKSARESEGIYASEAQLKLLLKRLQSKGPLSGVTRFVADFCSTDSKLLAYIDQLESNQ